MKICSVCYRCFGDSEELCVDTNHGELTAGPRSIDAVPGYVLEQKCFSSPKAVIFRARQLEYGQVCLISIAEADEAQFLSDADRAKRLFHSGVAGVVESGELLSGGAFAAFESPGGKNLRDVLHQDTLSLLDQIIIARQSAEAVHAIHAAGLVHGGLCPENIAIEGLGTEVISVKIHNIDLGGVIADGILSNRFSMDSARDSLRYFAPERFRGEQATLRSDVYSLGVILYELLSGHPPFEASSAAALADMHLNQKPPEIKIENFDLRMLLTHTISEALQKQPSFRQSTADLFARQMRHIEQLATHVSTPPPAVAIAMAAASPSRRSTAPQPPTLATRPINLSQPTEILRPASVLEQTPVGLTPIDPTRTEAVSIEPALANPAPVEPTPFDATPVVAAAVSLAEPAETPTFHPVHVEAPIPFAPTPKRSRLKGMKKRVHSYVSASKDTLLPKRTPTLIDWQQPEDDVPSVESVREDVAGSVEIPKFALDEDNTYDRPPADRIGVTWNEPTSVQPSRLAANFVPTLISGSRTVSDDPVFIPDNLHGFDLGKLPIYGVALFAFLIVGFGVVSLGSALTEDTDGYIGEARPVRTEIPAAPMRPPAQPQVSVMNISAEPVSIPAPPVSIPNTAETSFEKSAVAEEKVIERAKPKASKRVDPGQAPSAAIPLRQSVRTETPVVPSTLVITRGTGKPRTAIVSGDRERESRPTKVGTGATRPRIVRLPD